MGELVTAVVASNVTLLCDWLPAADNRFVAGSATDEGTKFWSSVKTSFAITT